MTIDINKTYRTKENNEPVRIYATDGSPLSKRIQGAVLVDGHWFLQGWNKYGNCSSGRYDLVEYENPLKPFLGEKVFIEGVDIAKQLVIVHSFSPREGVRFVGCGIHAGCYGKTAGGHDFKIYEDNKKGQYPIHGAIKDGLGCWISECWNKNGEYTNQKYKSKYDISHLKKDVDLDIGQISITCPTTLRNMTLRVSGYHTHDNERYFDF